MNTPYKIELGNNNYLRAASIYVRYEVFVLERGLNKEDEFDDYDLSTTIYAVCFINDQKPISVARLIIENDDVVRITRVATLKKYRGKKINRQIIKKLENFAKEKGYKKAIIHAELTAVSYYEEIGYKICSNIYIEDKTKCQSLQKSLI